MQKCWCGNDVNKKYSEHYYVCEKCHTLVSDVNFSEKIVHVENEDEDLYGKNYWEEMMCQLTGKNSLDEVVDSYLIGRTFYWLKYMFKYQLPSIDIAEIGAGLGQFCYVLKQAGYKTIGFELSKEICDYAMKWGNVNLHQGDISDIPKIYNVICSFDLIEHILDINDFIERCKEHLCEGGIFCFQTPCYHEEMSYEQMQNRLPRFKEHMKEEQHIWLFSKKSVEKLLREHGFNYINFEPAVFGDDYDMFVFASREPMKQNTEEEINEYLNSTENGRLIKSMISLYTQVNEKQKVIEELVAYKNYLENEIEERNKTKNKFKLFK